MVKLPGFGKKGDGEEDNEENKEEGEEGAGAAGGKDEEAG